MKYLVFILFYNSMSYASKCDQSGSQIMKLQNKKQSVRSEEEIQHIVILNQKTKIKEERKLKRLMIKKENSKKSLLYFYSPKEINGSGLLSWHEGGDENQWLYLPALKKLQRIATGSKKNYFMGTDFTYADLDGEILEDNKYTCLKTTPCAEGRYCYIIEAKPVNRIKSRSTGYSKRMLLVDVKRYTTTSIVYFNLKKEKFKEAKYLNWKNQKNVWRPNLAVMDRFNIQKTYIKIQSRAINESIDSKKFNKRFLSKEMHMK